MTIIRTTFDRAGDMYNTLFEDFLHIHFMMRTVLLLLIIWLIIYVFAQILQYVLMPILLMTWYHVFFRAWNYFFVETPHEWIYIRYHSKDKPNFAALYLRLCDRVRKNRLIISHSRYSGMVRRSQRFAAVLMIICFTISTLWIGAFGLHTEYAASAVPPAGGEAAVPPSDSVSEPPSLSGVSDRFEDGHNDAFNCMGKNCNACGSKDNQVPHLVSETAQLLWGQGILAKFRGRGKLCEKDYERKTANRGLGPDKPAERPLAKHRT